MHPIIQEDFVYIPNEVQSVPVEPGVNVLRIRKQGEKIFFTRNKNEFA